jgi:hypothetical protein
VEIRIAGLGAALAAFAQDPERPVRAIGEFSTMRYTKEHAYGYAFELSRDGEAAGGRDSEVSRAEVVRRRQSRRWSRLNATRRLVLATASHRSYRPKPSQPNEIACDPSLALSATSNLQVRSM